MKQLLIILTVVFLLVLSSSITNQAAVTEKKVQTVTSGYSIQAGVVKKVSITGIITPLAPSRITGIWANDGGDKVTRDELRARDNPDSVKNLIWNGKKISIFGARNEVVSFNLVLEASKQMASGVSVTLETLITLSGYMGVGRGRMEVKLQCGPIPMPGLNGLNPNRLKHPRNTFST